MTRQRILPAWANHIWSLLALLPLAAPAQVPVDDDGNEFGAEIEEFGDEDIPRLSEIELQELVGPIALYPDDLLAVVLPASTYPLQVIEAARFLEELEKNPALEPDEDWDDSIIALINYPEVVELLNDDLDWTWRLGEAVVAQQSDVIAAVETFRDRAYAAGNLKSDEYQTVNREEGIVSIQPATDDAIYVPYYEPTRVVVRQTRPVYYYYPRPYPVYYYPYPDSYSFNRGYFWGLTTAFTIGWATDHLSVYHHSYHGHPYYGRHYWNRWWYRRPTINVYNRTYIRETAPRIMVNNYYSGDRWRPSGNSGIVRRVTRNDYYVQSRDQRRSPSYSDRRTRSTHVVPATAGNSERTVRRQREDIRFRQRPDSFNRTVVRTPTPDKQVRRVAPPPRPAVQERERRTTPAPTQRQRQATAQQRREPRVTPSAQRRQPADTVTVRNRERQNVATPARERRSTPTQTRPPRVSTPQPRQARQSAPPQRQARQSAPPPRRQSAPPQRRESAPAPKRESAPAQKATRQASSREGSRRRDR